MSNSLDIIWNISLICPWDCEFCCTDAVHVSKTLNGILIREDSLLNDVPINHDDSIEWPKELNDLGLRPNFLDRALYDRQRRGRELTLSDKLKILNNLNVANISVDFAGGDPIACAENILIIMAAAKRYGQNNVSITSTGHSISRYPFEAIANSIGTFEFTYDEPSDQNAQNRPKGYNKSNITVAKKFSSAGIKTKCQIPLHKGNISMEAVAKIIDDLTRSEISEVLLMRVFPVGRGGKFLNSKNSLSAEETLRAIDLFRTSSLKVNGPQIRLQCALKHLDFEHKTKKNPCDMMQNSFGINYQGLLLTSAWATNEKGNPLSNDFVLGSLVTDSFTKISKSDKFQRYLARLDHNWGHCKIFSYVNSKTPREEAIFAQLDPLYLK